MSRLKTVRLSDSLVRELESYVLSYNSIHLEELISSDIIKIALINHLALFPPEKKIRFLAEEDLVQSDD